MRLVMLGFDCLLVHSSVTNLEPSPAILILLFAIAISNGSTQVHLIDFRVTVVCGNTIRVHSNTFRP